jgi:molecular chaperone GrpE
MCEQPLIPETGIPDWKARLKEELIALVDACPDLPAQPDSLASGDAPDLYSLYSELCAIKHLSEKTARRTHEKLTEFGSVIDRVDATVARQIDAADTASAIDEPAFIRRLLDLTDRMERLAGQLAVAPRPLFFTIRQRWTSLAEGFDGMIARTREMLTTLGIERMRCAGKPFDPHTMMAVATEDISQGEDGVVIQEIVPGFSRAGMVVRLAEVTVTRRKD